MLTNSSPNPQEDGNQMKTTTSISATALPITTTTTTTGIISNSLRNEKMEGLSLTHEDLSLVPLEMSPSAPSSIHQVLAIEHSVHSNNPNNNKTLGLYPASSHPSTVRSSVDHNIHPPIQTNHPNTASHSTLPLPLPQTSSNKHVASSKSINLKHSSSHSLHDELIVRYQTLSTENKPCCPMWFYDYLLCVRCEICPRFVYRKLCKCCFLGNSQRKSCAYNILYSKIYICVYMLIVAVTFAVIVEEISKEQILSGNQRRSATIQALDVLCVALMIFDICIQILAHPRTYWSSCPNICDFILVVLCVCSLPINWLVLSSHLVFKILILIRFCVQILRVIMIWRHHRRRSKFLKAAEHDIVDFSGFDDSGFINSAQGKVAPPPKTLENNSSNRILVTEDGWIDPRGKFEDKSKSARQIELVPVGQSKEPINT